MVKDIEVPETIGELVELLNKYPKDTKLCVYVSQLADVSVDEDQSWKMRVQDDWPNEAIFITFGNGYTLP